MAIVCRYSPATHDLATISMHAFEDYDMHQGRLQTGPGPVVKSDPDNRCVGMLVFGTKVG